jgi:prepilin-type N-terminal cleavage/methylation domain-containing protein
MTKNKGFSLVELLVALTIIAIMSGVALSALTGFRASARDTRRIGDLRNVQNYLELYFNKCGRYPGDANCGNTNPTNWAGLVTALGAVMGTAKVPNDPIPSRTYYYGVDTTAGQEGLRYVIGAQLERDNSLLKDDLDGNIYGVDCGSATNDTIYCIQS